MGSFETLAHLPAQIVEELQTAIKRDTRHSTQHYRQDFRLCDIAD